MTAATTATEPWITALHETVRGEVYSDAARRGMYATDASHYQVVPRCVVVPRDEADVTTALSIAREHGIPITGRGGGTSLAGQTFGPGIVLDFSKHMNQVLDVNPDERWARVQPGIVRDHLNKQLAPHGLFFAPDPATTSRATVGGMINNNSSGMRSVVYGMTIDHVLALRVMLSDGSVIELGQSPAVPLKQDGQRAQDLSQALDKLIEANRQEIERRYPKVMRRVSGYALDALTDPGSRNLAHLIVGSEGTLGLVLEATVRIVPAPGATALCVVHFNDLIDSVRHVQAMLEHQPSAIELLDEIIVSESMTNPATRAYADFYDGTPNCVQVVEFMADTPQAAADKARAFASDMARRGIGYAHVIRDQPKAISEVWELRRLGVGLQSNIGGRKKTLDFVDDACVPIEHLAEYIQKLGDICKKHGVRMPICCHASVGVLHPKPMLDLHEQEDRDKMRAIADEAFDLVIGYGGSWSGEHGDGTVRGEYVRRFFGDELYGVFRQIKQLFDPHGLMNPGKIIDTPRMDEQLRHNTPGYEIRLAEVNSNYHYREHGSLGLSVEQCNGVGACRKVGKGTMCPSYMATRNEQDSTRGRANALRLAMTGQLGEGGLTDEGVMDAMELCLSCKACKTECPNAVDMSKMKSDVLQMRHEKFGVPLSAKLVAGMPKMARRWSGRLAPISNAVQNMKPTRWLMRKLAGVDTRRSLPRLARQPLSQRLAPDDFKGFVESDNRVVLFDDTYSRWFEPGIYESAVSLLQGCGFNVIPAQTGCCQRPAMSKGMLGQAKQHGEATLRELLPFAEQGLPILFLEPSCASAICDDLPDLVEDRALGEAVSAACSMLDDFLAASLESGRLQGRFVADDAALLIHGHCHQKALFGTQGMHRLFSSIQGLEFSEVDSGCCGMAGSFGYEHYDLSMQIGEQRLFPAVREAQASGAAVCANGTSCRHQIKDGTAVQAKHWVELIRYEPAV